MRPSPLPQRHRFSEKRWKNGLIFSQHGDKLFFRIGFRPYEIRFSCSFYRLFQQKTSVNPPSFNLTFCSRRRNIPARTNVSLCLAGRFSCVSRAGSWRDLQMCARGCVRLFCVQSVVINIISVKPFVFGHCLVYRTINYP